MPITPAVPAAAELPLSVLLPPLLDRAAKYHKEVQDQAAIADNAGKEPTRVKAVQHAMANLTGAVAIIADVIMAFGPTPEFASVYDRDRYIGHIESVVRHSVKTFAASDQTAAEWVNRNVAAAKERRAALATT